jgi:putative endopeptidase
MSKPLSVSAIAAVLLAASAYASVDPTTFDLSVKPQDDFFRYANGTWIKNTPIPPEYSRWGAFDALQADPHSPMEFRCNGPLSNLDEFAAAFDVPEGAPMRRPAPDRVSIW